ncbi:hypothetical protein QR680_008649 [Steinernema hermaphroditum]|uniref:Regulator of microtubule dynamics protein 1 n=1 Tax=Steinernema hermaphroditum TaxID=289476 RepID=A0AA39IHC3_9BILA|nr:hypothetical protein QR680_008649 [Steinernema hermaphroditum]
MKSAQFVFRQFAQKYWRNATRTFSSPAARRLVTGTASGGLLSASFFTSGPTGGYELPKRGEVPNLDLIIKETDALYNNYLIDNAYAILRKHGSGTCPELLWRLARVVCEKAKLAKDKKEKDQLFMEALAIVEKALEYEEPEGCFGAHKWYAIILDYVGEIEGTKSRIKKSYEVREHLERALEINDGDATTWHILGVWHFTFADMPYYTRLAAKAIFGTPPSSTYEDALKNFERAEFIQPNFYSTNTFYLAETYDRLGRKDLALEYYKRAFLMPVVSADDGEIHKKAHDKLKKLGVKIAELVESF